MRFALLGNHPDGLALAHAMCATGRHELVVCQGSEPPNFARSAKVHQDLEDVLADPAIELVIVAGSPAVREAQLRRALQSEHDTLCVHPCAEKPDIAYEAALIQADTKRLLLPMLPDSLHPVFARARTLLDDEQTGFRADGELFRLLQAEYWTTGESVSTPAWDVLRRLGGDIVEVSGLAAGEEFNAAKPAGVSGLFEKGGFFQITILPLASQERSRLTIHGAQASAEVEGPDAFGRARLRWRREGGEWQEESFGPVERWLPFIELVESARDKSGVSISLSWQDEVRGLELDDALRRSIEKRRTSSLEFQEISEEVGSKGTLTLIGCGMIWLILLVFMISIWVPWIRWLIVPMLVGYLILLGMNMLVRRKS